MTSAANLILQRIKNDPEIDFLKVLARSPNAEKIKRSGWATPAVFVYKTGVRAYPKNRNFDNSRVIQDVDVFYHVVFITNSNLDKDLGGVQDISGQQQNLIVKALLGYRPFGLHQLFYGGGQQRTDLDRNKSFWVDSFTLRQVLVSGVGLATGNIDEDTLDASDDFVWINAATDLEVDRVVIPTDFGARYVDVTSETDGLKSPCITTSSATANSAVRVQAAGLRESDTFSAFPVGTALYLGADGVLTDVTPTQGLFWRLATVQAPNTIYFEPDDSIFIGA